MKLKKECPKCHKAAILKGEVKVGTSILKALQCGHLFSEKLIYDSVEELPTITVSDTAIRTLDETVELARFDDDGNVLNYAPYDESFNSLDLTKRAYPFQVDGVKFAESTNLNCLIADEMGLGKTVQALLAMKRNRKRTLICVKGSITFQWAQQAKVWFDRHPLSVMPIINRDTILPGFDVYIISIDFMSRKGVLDKLKLLGIEMIVVDECQNFKDSNSKRTKALIQLIEDNRIVHKIFLSGTPIKNKASEYFTILNLLAPERFTNYASFCRYWLVPNDKGVYTRLDPIMVEQFHQLTSKWILRREVKDVQKNLPKLTRDIQWVEIDDPVIKNAYNNELDMFNNFLRTATRIDSTTLLGWLAKMRAITGQAKIPWALEYAEQFMEQSEHPLLIGIHHHAVRDVLFVKLQQLGFNPSKFSGEDNQFAKERIKQNFINGNNRVMVMNMIAGGTGTDGLQKVCHNAVVLERQWSSADEQQFEKRLDRDGQTYPCDIVYPIAVRTIDEWFHNLVEEKRKIIRETMGDSEAMEFDPTSDSELIMNLAEMTVSHRL